MIERMKCVSWYVFRLMFRALSLLRRMLAQSPPRVFIVVSWWLLIVLNVMSLQFASRKWP